MSASSIFLPLRAVLTAVSIISSARRMVPWFRTSIALRIAAWSSSPLTSIRAFSSLAIFFFSSLVSWPQAGLFSAFSRAEKSPAWGQLTSDEKKKIAKLEKALIEVKGEDDHAAIRKAIDVLNHGTMRLAELMMDTAVSTALKGKNMEEADMGQGTETGHPVARADFE